MSDVSKQQGFTLLEVLVVVMLLALLSGTILVGINAVTGRQLESESDQLISWLQWVQQGAVLGGSHYGIAEKQQQLVVVAPLGGQWFQVLQFDPWLVPEGLSLQVPAEERLAVDEDETQFFPFMVFTNTGLIEPVATLILSSNSDKRVISWQDGEIATVEPNE